VDPAPPHDSDPGRSSTYPAGSLMPAVRRWMVRAFPWHAGIMLAGNVLLNGVNVVTGSPWWAFWPLAVTGLALGVHYLFYKTAAVDERWVAERTEELNLKSYDRSHIENLKSRYSDDAPGGDRTS
jgi:hypothetical protein